MDAALDSVLDLVALFTLSRQVPDMFPASSACLGSSLFASLGMSNCSSSRASNSSKCHEQEARQK